MLVCSCSSTAHYSFLLLSTILFFNIFLFFPQFSLQPVVSQKTQTTFFACIFSQVPQELTLSHVSLVTLSGLFLTSFSDFGRNMNLVQLLANPVSPVKYLLTCYCQEVLISNYVGLFIPLIFSPTMDQIKVYDILGGLRSKPTQVVARSLRHKNSRLEWDLILLTWLPLIRKLKNSQTFH